LRPEAAPEEIFTRDTITKRMPKILVPWKFMGRTENAETYPLVNVYKKLWKKTPFSMGRSTINGHFQ
jgi:hypothetical protein